jgi:DNA-binding CsgD family transcriptional regulator
LFLFNTVHDSERIEEVVRTMYKLSPTEAKIAARLVFNPYLADISTSLGITYNTARTHLKRIYQKTDTNKLPSLIQKIVTGPAGLLIHSTD